MKNQPFSRVHKASAAIATLATVAFGLTACDGGSQAATDPNVIRVVDYYTSENTETKSIADTLNRCASEAGVTIRREPIAGESLISKVLQMSSSKTLPDVLMLDNPDLQEIAASGALAPLGQFGIKPEGFNEQVIQAGSYNGSLYGLAPTVNTIALFYNVDMLRAKNLKPPKTWDELKKAAKELSGNGVYGFAMAASASYEGTWQFLPFMWTNGGDETSLGSAQVEGASQFVKDLQDSGSMSKSVVNWDQGAVMDQFKAGKAAMVVNGPWQIPGLNEDAPNLNWGTALIPVPREGAGSIAPLGGEVWTVPQTGNPTKQKSAAAVVNCMNSEVNQQSMANTRFTIPSRITAAKEFAVTHPDMAVFVSQVKTARSRTGKLGVKWPSVAKAIYTANQQVLTGSMTPAEAFGQAQEAAK